MNRSHTTLTHLFRCTFPFLGNGNKERDRFLESIKDTNERFLTTIDSYRAALTEFQRKEDEFHQHLAQLIKECRTSVAADHKEIMRGLKAGAKKLNADIIE